MAVFKVPKSKGTTKANRFEFQIGEDTFNVPKMQYVTGEMVSVLSLMEQRQSSGTLDVIDLMYKVFGMDNPALARAVKALDVEQVNSLFLAWTEASDITPGELPAS